ncbi:hypothetical protein L1887_08262 [Cichorium endivia]|nr:hypothetical protein L1887_08262 [Cichorium endivia]
MASVSTPIPMHIHFQPRFSDFRWHEIKGVDSWGLLNLTIVEQGQDDFMVDLGWRPLGQDVFSVIGENIRVKREERRKLTCDQPGPNLNLNKRDGATEKNKKYWARMFAPPPDSGGVSSSGARVLEHGGKEGEGGDDWDNSDSEDDLQIVLNDNTGGGIMGMDSGVGQDEEDD